ncbi:competence protein ComK [Bacillus paralicheniformis]|uniref:competence protein ComK n=1 Tax=Bacillus paralicheniformis TaxID=1648923 RepID=UPI0011A02254
MKQCYINEETLMLVPFAQRNSEVYTLIVNKDKFVIDENKPIDVIKNSMYYHKSSKEIEFSSIGILGRNRVPLLCVNHELDIFLFPIPIGFPESDSFIWVSKMHLSSVQTNNSNMSVIYFKESPPFLFPSSNKVVKKVSGINRFIRKLLSCK